MFYLSFCFYWLQMLEFWSVCLWVNDMHDQTAIWPISLLRMNICVNIFMTLFIILCLCKTLLLTEQFVIFVTRCCFLVLVYSSYLSADWHIILLHFVGKSLLTLVLEQFDDLLVKILLLAAVISLVSSSLSLYMYNTNIIVWVWFAAICWANDWGHCSWIGKCDIEKKRCECVYVFVSVFGGSLAGAFVMISDMFVNSCWYELSNEWMN